MEFRILGRTFISDPQPSQLSPPDPPCPAQQPQGKGSPLLPLDISQSDALISDFEVDHSGCGEDVPLKGG